MAAQQTRPSSAAAARYSVNYRCRATSSLRFRPLATAKSPSAIIRPALHPTPAAPICVRQVAQAGGRSRHLPAEPGEPGNSPAAQNVMTASVIKLPPRLTIITLRAWQHSRWSVRAGSRHPLTLAGSSPAWQYRYPDLLARYGCAPRLGVAAARAGGRLLFGSFSPQDSFSACLAQFSASLCLLPASICRSAGLALSHTAYSLHLPHCRTIIAGLSLCSFPCSLAYLSPSSHWLR